MFSLKPAFVLIAFFAITNSSFGGTQSIGENTFKSTAWVAFSGIVGAKEKALEAAKSNCANRGREFILKDLSGSECGLRGGCGKARITYICIGGDGVPARSSASPMVADQGTNALYGMDLNLPAEDEMSDATGAYQKHDYQTTIKLARPLADKGNTAAQNMVGLLYENGLAVPQDFVEASKWYKLSAKGGNVFGQLNLGRIYCTGTGIHKKSEVEAVKWFMLSAAQGNNEAKMRLGKLYGVRCEITMAEFLTSAGVPLDADAKATGFMVPLTEDRTRRNLLAYAWYNLAAAGFASSDLKSLQIAIAERDEAAKKLTQVELAQAQAFATKWLSEHPNK